MAAIVSCDIVALRYRGAPCYIQVNMTAKLISSLQSMDSRLSRLDERLQGVEGRFDLVTNRIRTLEERFDVLGVRFNGLEKRLHVLAKGIDDLEGRLEGHMKGFRSNGLDLASSWERSHGPAREQVPRLGKRPTDQTRP
jgi:hypothetical protein